VILTLGSLKPDELPDWSADLLHIGFMVVAFAVEYPPDPNPARRPVWLHFDPRFAHSYVLGGIRTPKDASRVIDYLASRPDVDAQRIGWLGSSTTGIFGIAAATREPRIKAIVAFVATGLAPGSLTGFGRVIKPSSGRKPWLCCQKLTRFTEPPTSSLAQPCWSTAVQTRWWIYRAPVPSWRPHVQRIEKIQTGSASWFTTEWATIFRAMSFGSTPSIGFDCILLRRLTHRLRPAVRPPCLKARDRLL
jgi:hypothetical protein